MHKAQAAWLVVRIIGLIFLAAAACMAFEFVINVFAIASFDAVVPAGGDTVRLPNLRLDPLAGDNLFYGAAVYFLRFGQMVHGWLLREGP